MKFRVFFGPEAGRLNMDTIDAPDILLAKEKWVKEHHEQARLTFIVIDSCGVWV